MNTDRWQEYTVIIERALGLGYGIAISGGRDNPGVQTGDPSIVISDVVRQGPAFDKLKINDIVTRINGKPTFNMEHRQAIKELKNCGQRVELTIRRKVVSSTPPARRRDYNSLPRHRSRSRDPGQDRRRARSRDFDDGSRRRRGSKSRDFDSRDNRRSRKHSRSRSRSRTSPPRRRRNRSRSSSRSRERSRSYRRGRSRSRSRTPPRRRTRSPTPSRSDSFSSSNESPTPSRHDSPPHKMEKYKPVEDLRASLPHLSPDPHEAVADDNMMVFPVQARPPKTVVLKKSRWNSSYGIKFGTRIFIQDIQPGSLAAKNPEITKGDTVLMINGRNVDNKTVDDAIRVIGLSKDKVTMLLKKDDGGTVSLPADRFNASATAKPQQDSTSEVESHHSTSYRSRSRKSSASKESVGIDEVDLSSVSSNAAATSEKKQVGAVRVLPPRSGASAIRSSSSSSSLSVPKPAPRSTGVVEREYSVPPGPEEDDGPMLPPDARQITFVKERSVGIRLAGGNDVGIFVASVQDGSTTAKQGLKIGDKILSVNNISFRNVIREEAVLTLMGLPTGSEVRIIAQAQPELYKKIVERGTGDSFYIRTHFKYEKNGVHELSFRHGSTFLVIDTLYNGMVGYWLAVRIGRNNKEIERGVIPNSSRSEQLKMVQDKKKSQQRERSHRGISRRLIKSQKTDTTKSSSAASSLFPAYEKVVLREAGFKRPVVIFGPLADIARERLVEDYPSQYQFARNEGLVSGQKSNRKGVIRLNTIKDIIVRGKHAVLDITPTAVEKLNYTQLYPIVVFLDPHSKAAVKDLRHKLATTDQEKKKRVGKLYDRANKLHRGYGHVFTDSIKLTSGSDDWYTKLTSSIRDQQNKPVWVSEEKLGVSPDEAEEGVMVPGDDDQFSYVSAPASDYSATTVGSEFNNSRISDDDDTKVKDFIQPKLRHSTSSDDDDGKRFDDNDIGDVLSSSDEEDSPSLTQPVLPPVLAESNSSSETPARDDKATEQPQLVSSSSSSSEDEEEPVVEIITHDPPQSPMRVTPSRGRQEIPPGRFDPHSFLKTHIQGLKSSDDSDELNSPPVTDRSHNEQHQPSAVEAVPLHRQTSLERTTGSGQERQQPEPVYAKVDKRRKVVESQRNFQNQREPLVRPSSGELNDATIQSDTLVNARYQDTRQAPIRQEPTRHVSPPKPKPAGTYNRFAGSTQPKPYQPYNPPLKPYYQRHLVSNGGPQKSKFQQEEYKGYVNQIKPAQTTSSYDNPRPYTKPGPKLNHGMGSQEPMYDSGVDAYDNANSKKETVPVSNVDENDPEVVASARGVFDSNGGVLSSVETGVSIVIPKGAIRPGVRQEIYFKVCRDNSALPPLDKDRGETLLSPLVMCGPHGLQFEYPVELRLPHCEPSQWQDAGDPNKNNNYEVGSNSVSVLIDHF